MVTALPAKVQLTPAIKRKLKNVINFE